MKSCLFQLPDEQADALRRLSEETKVPAVRHVRQAIENYLSGQIPCGLITSGFMVSGHMLILRVN